MFPPTSRVSGFAVNPPVPMPCPIRGRYKFAQSGPDSELIKVRAYRRGGGESGATSITTNVQPTKAQNWYFSLLGQVQLQKYALYKGGGFTIVGVATGTGRSGGCNSGPAGCNTWSTGVQHWTCWVQSKFAGCMDISGFLGALQCLQGAAPCLQGATPGVLGAP